jgi:hypothetical protein
VARRDCRAQITTDYPCLLGGLPVVYAPGSHADTRPRKARPGGDNPAQVPASRRKCAPGRRLSADYRTKSKALKNRHAIGPAPVRPWPCASDPAGPGRVKCVRDPIESRAAVVLAAVGGRAGPGKRESERPISKEPHDERDSGKTSKGAALASVQYLPLNTSAWFFISTVIPRFSE